MSLIILSYFFSLAHTPSQLVKMDTDCNNGPHGTLDKGKFDSLGKCASACFDYSILFNFGSGDGHCDGSECSCLCQLGECEERSTTGTDLYKIVREGEQDLVP